MIRELLKVYYRTFRNFYESIGVSVNDTPVIVLGNQKSGTSAVAQLLGRATGRSVRVDFFHLLRGVEEERLHSGKRSFDDFISRYPQFFSQDVVKEPGLTFFYEELKKAFPKAKFVFVLRDPRDNIRSLLNRLSIPGDLDEISERHYKAMPNDIWRYIVSGRDLKISKGNYAERMAERWLRAVRVFENNKEDFFLLRYEDFLEDKVASITNLAVSLGLESVGDISPIADKPFQPGGDNSASWEEFYGGINLERINQIVSDTAVRYGYQK